MAFTDAHKTQGGHLPYHAAVTVCARGGQPEHTVHLTSPCHCAWIMSGALAEVICSNGMDCLVQAWRGDRGISQVTERFYPADTSPF